MRGSSTNDNQEEGRSQADLLYTCPKCGSNRITIGYPDIRCFSCGYLQPLIDFPISWDWHRKYCREYGLPDPGRCEPPKHTVEELHNRLPNIEERLARLSEEKQHRLGLKLIWDEVKEVRIGLRHTQRLIPQVLPERKAIPRKLTRGVEL